MLRDPTRTVSRAACRGGDQSRKLGGDGQEEGFLGARELPVVGLPHREHAQHAAILHDRYAKEGVVCLLSVLGKITKAWMLLRIRHAERLSRFENHADEPFAPPELDPADRFGVESVGRHQDATCARRLDEVDGAYVDGQGFFDPTHDNSEGTAQAGRAVKFLRDLAQRVEH